MHIVSPLIMFNVTFVYAIVLRLKIDKESIFWSVITARVDLYSFRTLLSLQRLLAYRSRFCRNLIIRNHQLFWH